MKNVLSKKLKNRKGFTLAELLIVVAIIAVLVAIMIPVFGQSRANAIQAKDMANIRSAYAEAVLDAMRDYTSGDLTVSIERDKLNLSTITSVDDTTSAGDPIEVTTTGASEETKEIAVDDNVIVEFT